MLSGNIFGLILMAARDVYSTLNKDFCWPSRAKGIIDRDLKFAGYVPHYKILTGNIFGLILKNMAATGVSLSVMKSAYISLIVSTRSIWWILWFSVCYAPACREIFGVNALRGKQQQLGSPNLQDIFIGG